MPIGASLLLPKKWGDLQHLRLVRVCLTAPVRRAEKLRRRAGMAWRYGPIKPHSETLTIAAEPESTKILLMLQDQANVSSRDRPHGECQLKNDWRRT